MNQGSNKPEVVANQQPDINRYETDTKLIGITE